MASPNMPEGSDNLLYPEREPLKFDICTTNLDEETSELLLHIKKVAESILYHWRSFPIVLPPPITVQCTTAKKNVVILEPSLVGDQDNQESISTDSCIKEKPLELYHAFVAPSFDELDSVALNAKGDPRKLTRSHLENISEKGEFEVESMHFPGQNHRWRLSECLQKGSERKQEDLLNDVAKSAGYIVVTARNRFSSTRFSVMQSVHSLWTGATSLLDLIFGIPWLQVPSLDEKIEKERCNYLAQELSLIDGDVQPVCYWVKEKVKRFTKEKFKLSLTTKQPPVSYEFCTPQGQQLDLQLFNKKLMAEACVVLRKIIEKESRGWFLHFREQTIAELKGQGLGDVEVEKETNRRVQEEYQGRVYASILVNEELLKLGDNVPALLVNQAKGFLLIRQAFDEVDKIYKEGERARRQELKHTQPILSKIDSWLEEDLRSNHQILMTQHKWRPYEHALSLCRQAVLNQQAYFLQRALAFMKEREPVLQKELKYMKEPTRVFKWETPIWFPRNFVVNRSFQGNTEIIPTVLANSTTTITAPRLDPNQPIFLLKDQIEHTTSTRWPFWRWYNYLNRTWSLSMNTLFFFAIWLPFCSCISLRALFSYHPFMPDCELSQVNGTVCPSKGSLTATMISRLLLMWRNISKSRTHFETLPDTGFIGKGVWRHLNRVWNYVIKGFFGTLLLMILFPIVSILVSISSLLVALAVPLWVPASTLISHLFSILVFDFDAPTSSGVYVPLLRCVLWDIVIMGLIQPVVAVLFATLVCPVLSLIHLTFACVRWGSRHVWDKMMFHCVIEKRGRIPACDSILVNRVSGPGLHDDFVYQISPEQAVAAFESRLELEKLELFELDQRELIFHPLTVYNDFVRQCFGPFSAMPNTRAQYGRIQQEEIAAREMLCTKLVVRRFELSTGLLPRARDKVKMTTHDLKQSLKAAVILLETFYPQHIFPNILRVTNEQTQNGDDLLDEVNTLLRQGVIARVPATSAKRRSSKKCPYENEEAWWESKGLPQGDYTGLATIFFGEIFSTDFLTPMDEKDTVFQMETRNVNLSRYTKLLQSLPARPDLDEKLTVHTPRGNINVQLPQMKLSWFKPEEARSPTTGVSAHVWKCGIECESRRGEEVVHLPPQVPHPCEIAVIIYNRDAVDPISFDTFETRAVVGLLKDSPQLTADMDTPSGLDDTRSQISDSTSKDDLSLYDDPLMYSRRYGRSFGPSRSRTATLEMTATLERGADQTKSSTLESLAGKASSWLSSPLRTLLEGVRPFSVNLNLAAAEEGSVEGGVESQASSSHTTAV